ncbi:MAG TPA: hypothetical protein VG675_17750 [Bryobacteraceae bacterium]|nr:hypothetical protein [Bryobacteraceae bacterium]
MLQRIRAGMIANLTQLPNYTCHEVVNRFYRSINSGRLDHVDVVEFEVAFVNNRELFARPGADRFDEQSITNVVSNGTIGNGAFGSHAESIFSENVASFKYGGQSKKEGHKTFRYDFEVPQEKSHFQVKHAGAEGIVGYKGSFWVDIDSLELVRLELKAEHIPSYIGVSSVHEVIRYKRVQLKNSDFLLPGKSELTATDTSGSYSLNMTNLERCREFVGESAVTFDTPGSTAPTESQAPSH